MSKQDEKLRQRRRLQDRAIELASKNRWGEAIDVNRQALELEQSTDTYNRLGKAYFELGKLGEARDSYQQGFQLTPSNLIARRNLERINELLAHSNSMSVPDRTGRELVDLRLFITEIGKTAVTNLVDVPRGPATDAIVTGEKVELRVEGRNVLVIDADGNTIGRIEPKLAQRLSELILGGNRYASAIAQTSGHQLRVLVREVYQDPSQRNRISFPGKFGDGALRGYIPAGTYDEFGEDLLEEDDTISDTEDVEEEAFGGDEEELGLDDIEQDMGDDEDMNEE